jgi:hypothetical protein
VRKWLRLALILLSLLVVALVLGGWALYRASRAVPEFYQKAIHVDAAAQEAASEVMIQRATTLSNQVKREGHWEAVFTADQINGWLAVDMVRNHPDLLPPTFRDPRVAISPGQMTIACQYHEGSVESVLSLVVDAYLAEPNVIGIRFRRVRAGLVPLPMERVTAALSQAAAHAERKIQWQQADGDPVALITIPTLVNGRGKIAHIESLKLGEGEVYVAGTTQRK